MDYKLLRKKVLSSLHFIRALKAKEKFNCSKEIKEQGGA